MPVFEDHFKEPESIAGTPAREWMEERGLFLASTKPHVNSAAITYYRRGGPHRFDYIFLDESDSALAHYVRTLPDALPGSSCKTDHVPVVLQVES